MRIIKETKKYYKLNKTTNILQDWLNSYDNVKWWIANGWIRPMRPCLNVLQKEYFVKIKLIALD